MNEYLGKIVKCTYNGAGEYQSCNICLTEGKFVFVGRALKVHRDGHMLLLANQECATLDDVSTDICRWASWVPFDKFNVEEVK